MKTYKLFVIAMLAILMCANFTSCGNKSNKSKERIQHEINYLNDRINTLERIMPEEYRKGNLESARQMKNNLNNYRTRVDELNRQMVRAR